MWYFTWVLGVGFAVCFSIISALAFDARAKKECDSNCKNECKSKK